VFGWDLFRRVEDTVRWREGAVVYMVTKLQVFVKSDKYVDQLSDCHLFKKELFHELNARCYMILLLIKNGVQKTYLLVR
jgi:hypothetical protein